MNGKLWTVESPAGKETGDVWGVTIPYPAQNILDDMGWGAFDSFDKVVLLEAYVIRRLKNPDGSYSLNIRFHDRSKPPRDPKEKITIRFIHPQP